VSNGSNIAALHYTLSFMDKQMLIQMKLLNEYRLRKISNSQFKSMFLTRKILISIVLTGILFVLLSILKISNDFVHLFVFSATCILYIILKIDSRILFIYGVLSLVMSAANMHHSYASNYAVLAFWFLSAGVVRAFHSLYIKENLDQRKI
jgi:hypothetical protein